MTAACQVRDLSLRNWLPCPFRESGGRQCERAEIHGDEIPHYFSPHTVSHDRAGNGWACDSFKEQVNTVAYRARLVAEITDLNAELEEIDNMEDMVK